MKKTIAMALTCAAFSLHGTAGAEEVLLKFAYTAPLVSSTYTQFWGPWVEKLNREGQGEIKVEVFGGNSVATIGNVYDRLTNNVVQIGYGIQAISGKFPLTNVCTLPFLSDEAAPASTACWNLYANGTIAAEYADIHPIAISAFTHSGLHTNKPLKRLDDLKGLKIATTLKPTGDAVQALGGTPIAMAISDFYQAQSRGVVDGIAIPWVGMTQFKLQEVTKDHLDVALGSGASFFAMNKGAYTALSAAAKQVIDRNSGVDVSTGYGKVLDDIHAQQRATVAAMPGHTITKLEAAEEERWRKVVEPTVDQWATTTPNGAAVVAAFKAELAKAKGAAK